MLNQEKTRLWIDALRSGEYKQTTGGLQHQNEDGSFGYCCLGVLCEVARKNGLDIEYTAPEENEDGDLWGQYEREALMPPRAVQEWIGAEGATDWEIPDEIAASVKGYDIDDDDQPFRDDGTTGLAGLNDEMGFTFAEIADVIEQSFLDSEKV